MDNLGRSLPSSLPLSLLRNEGHTERNSSPLPPLRRRASILIRRTSSASSFSENDDDAERIARRRQQKLKDIGTPRSGASVNSRRGSLGFSYVGQIPEKEVSKNMERCIKLGTENKINMKNAFSLEIIDYMAYMIKNRQERISLQVAGVSLEACSQVYGYRVDRMYKDILKMVQGFAEFHSDPNDASNDVSDEPRGRKKHSKKKILSTVDALKGNVEVLNPNTLMMNQVDVQTADLLDQARLPYHEDGTFSLSVDNDVILDEIPDNEPLQSVEIQHPQIVINPELDICPSFNDFRFLGWYPEPSPADPAVAEPSPQDYSTYRFDMAASLPEDDGPQSPPVFDMEDYNEEITRECGPVRLENIADVSSVISACPPNASFEYSYLQDTVPNRIKWVGPLHWKVMPLTRSENVLPARRPTGTKKKDITIDYKAGDAAAEFLQGEQADHRSKSIEKWTEEKLCRPNDISYETQNFRQYFWSKLPFHFHCEGNVETTHLSDEVGVYNYQNEFDETYVPDLPMDNEVAGPSGLQALDPGEAGPSGFQTDLHKGTGSQLVGQNLIAAPQVPSGTYVPYALTHKHIDEGQLQKAIWQSLTKTAPDEENVASGSGEAVEGKAFSEVYKELPSILSENDAAAVSLPRAFVALLAVANKKNLEITSNEECSDVFIKKD